MERFLFIKFMDPTGVEPVTFAMRMRRSTS